MDLDLDVGGGVDGLGDGAAAEPLADGSVGDLHPVPHTVGVLLQVESLEGQHDCLPILYINGPFLNLEINICRIYR